MQLLTVFLITLLSACTKLSSLSAGRVVISYKDLSPQSHASLTVKDFSDELGWQDYQSETILGRANHAILVRFVIEASESSRVFCLHQLQAGEANQDYRTHGYVLQGGELVSLQSELDRTSCYRLEAKAKPRTIYTITKIGQIPLISKVEGELMSVEQFQSKKIFDTAFIGLFTGIFLGLLLYNLMSFFITRKSYLAYYPIYAVFLLYWLLWMYGVVPWSKETVIFLNLATAVWAYFFVLFAFSLLEVRRHHRSLYWVGQSMLVLYSLGLLSACFGSLIFVPIAYLLAPLLAGILIYVTLVSALRRNVEAIPLLIGYFLVFIASLLTLFGMGLQGFPQFIWAVPLAFSIEQITFSLAIAIKIQVTERHFTESNQHAFEQMSKLIYQHQLDSIRAGKQLENTMPVSPGEACVLAFDIIGSTNIRHIGAKLFFRRVFARCNQVMMANYDSTALKARAYRIKEVGDGFLCSVGYPFASIHSNPAIEAIALAEEFIQVLEEEAKLLHPLEPICCGIGIALDSITGYFPEEGTKTYDVQGTAIVLATRYEAMRKVLLDGTGGQHILIIQEAVFQSLEPHQRQGFTEVNLGELGVSVRDDISAKRLYYRCFISRQMERNQVAS